MNSWSLAKSLISLVFVSGSLSPLMAGPLSDSSQPSGLTHADLRRCILVVGPSRLPLEPSTIDFSGMLLHDGSNKGKLLVLTGSGNTHLLTALRHDQWGNPTFELSLQGQVYEVTSFKEVDDRQTLHVNQMPNRNPERVLKEDYQEDWAGSVRDLENLIGSNLPQGQYYIAKGDDEHNAEVAAIQNDDSADILTTISAISFLTNRIDRYPDCRRSTNQQILNRVPEGQLVRWEELVNAFRKNLPDNQLMSGQSRLGGKLGRKSQRGKLLPSIDSGFIPSAPVSSGIGW